MNIAIDANEANTKTRVGSGQYALNILKHWHKVSNYNFHLYLKNSPVSDMPTVNSHWHYHIIKPNKLWLKFSMPLHFITKRPNISVFFSPAHYSPPLIPSPLVVTIHDLAYEYFPNQFFKKDLYKLKKWTVESINKASRIIAVSQNTKKDIVSLYGVDPDKITVIHNGYDRKRFNARVKKDPVVLKKYGIDPNDRYILYLGTIQPRKNIVKLEQAFHLLKKYKQYDGKLVIAGNPGWLSESTMKAIRSSRFVNDIIVTGYIDNKDLPVLYRYADIYVLPSLYEGFGIPVLEAMASGTPVAVSSNSSLPEVVGNAGELFSANDPMDIKDTILKVLSDRQKYIRKGYNHVRKFSWEKTAKQTLDLLISTANEYNHKR